MPDAGPVYRRRRDDGVKKLLFVFHLLEWMDVNFELSVRQLNQRWARPDNIDAWSQLVIKHTADT